MSTQTKVKELIQTLVEEYGHEVTCMYFYEEFGVGDVAFSSAETTDLLQEINAIYGSEANRLFFEDGEAFNDSVEAFFAGEWAPETEEATATTVVSPAQPIQTVSYPDPTRDNFEVQFQDFQELVLCNRELEKTERVSSHDEDLVSAGGVDTANIKVSPVPDIPVAASGEASRMGCGVDALLDTMRSQGGTGLSIKLGNTEVPVGMSAMSGLRDRAGFTEDGLMRHWTKSSDDAAAALNRQFANWKRTATVIERAGKVRSFMGQNFAYGKFSDILAVFEEFWNQKYPKATVQNCYLNHTIMRWDMNLEEYRDSIFNGFPDLQVSGYTPMLMFAVSNTGDSAFRVSPALAVTGSEIVVPISQYNGDIAVRHVAKGNFQERCDALLQQIMQSYKGIDTMLQSANANLEHLKNTTVRNAYNALLRTMDDCGFPKQQGMEAASNFLGVYGKGQATAFDCFIACVNAYSFFVRDYPNNTTRQFTVRMSVGKAANAPWQVRGEIPGDYSWN